MAHLGCGAWYVVKYDSGYFCKVNIEGSVLGIQQVALHNEYLTETHSTWIEQEADLLQGKREFK